MSFVDLATLAMHRRNELEERVNAFNTKCETAIRNIKILKTKAQGLTLQLNCDPTDLKEHFLLCMQELEKYMYLMTDIILATETLDEPHLTRDCTPVLDSASIVSAPLPVSPFNIIDTLSEPRPSTSLACNRCPPEKPKRQKIPKEQQVLIEFSSSSCSQESVNEKREVKPVKTEMVAKEIQCDIITQEISNIKVEDEDAQSASRNCILPAQDILEVDHCYPATITHVDGSNFWAITANVDEVHVFMTDMTNYYKENHKILTKEEIVLMTYCAFLDEDCYYRALMVKLLKNEKTVEVYLVDTGELRCGPFENVQYLHPQYATVPPYARHCHLAGIDTSIYSEEVVRRQEEFIKNYIINTICTIEIDDNTSESLGVYVKLSNNETLNEIMVREGLVLPLEKQLTTPRPGAPEEFAVDDDDLDITVCPEYEDPVEAVTGYHNRDEADICKHYKGGPEKTCFKGALCKKKHIAKHPDGWTMDQMPVVTKCELVPLPAPDSWVTVVVTCVAHFNKFHVQFVNDHEREEVPTFGTVLPPRTLAGLIKDMNSPASLTAYKPYTVAPAVGELVAALFMDKKYYRARVRSITRADQSVELVYVDYGTVMWVKEDAVKELHPRWVHLPAQAVPCSLAGVAARTTLSQQWVLATKQLADLALDKVFTAHVLARGYDELTVALFDADGYSIGEKLAEQGLVTCDEDDVVPDAHLRHRVVVP